MLEPALSGSFPRWGKAGMGASSLNHQHLFAHAESPHPNLPPKAGRRNLQIRL